MIQLGKRKGKKKKKDYKKYKINKMKGNLNNHDSTGKIKNKKKLETIGNGPNEWISPLDWPKQK
jgi:hypothetical protein